MRRKGVGKAIYEEIKSGILDGTFPEGGKLPSEASLCEEHQVSRPVVREALARLRVEGLIFSRRGSGTFVRERAEDPDSDTSFAPVTSLPGINQCFDFRLSLEGEAAFHAAQNREESDLEAIESTMERFEAAREAGAGGDADDFAFHCAVAEASRIYFFSSVMESMRRSVMVGMKLAEELSRVEPRERLRLVLAEHRAVLEAIRDRDPERARAAMRAHIDLSRQRLFQGQS